MTTPRATSIPRHGGIYRAGAVAALAIVALIPPQIVAFSVWPPPGAVVDWFARFQQSWLLGLISADLLFLVSNTLLALVYLALYFALREEAESAMTIALVLGLLGIAAYLASNTAFEMLALSRQYAVATTEAERAIPLAAGRAMLVTSTGTTFDVYYVLDAIFLLIVAPVMLRGRTFSRLTGYMALASGVLMLIPSSAGTVGMIFSLASLVPWVWFSILITRRMWALSVVGRRLSVASG